MKEIINKQATVLLFALLVIVVLSILLGSFFVVTMSENELTTSYVNSIRAFWAAEAGIARFSQILTNLSEEMDSSIGYRVNLTQTPFSINNTTYYEIISEGRVNVPATNKFFIRRLRAIVATRDVRNDNFRYAIASTSNISITGNAARIVGDNGCLNCTGKSCNCSVMNSTQCCGKIGYPSFSGLFGIDFETMRQEAINQGHYYNNNNFTSPVSGITWVEGNLTRAGNAGLAGTGILVVTGDADLRGNIDFRGILYVVGKLVLRGGGGGDPNISGAVISASNATIQEDDELIGRVFLERNETYIGQALNNTRSIMNRTLCFWRQEE